MENSSVTPPVAVVGIAVQLPSGDFSREDLNLNTFWELLSQGRHSFQPLKETQLVDERYDLPERGAFLKGMTNFDHFTFGTSIKEARAMPYATRRLIELSFLSLAESGIDSRHSRVGCFMSGNIDFENQDAMDPDGAFGYTTSALANRVSYCLRLNGPSVYIDTACSSSLTALHLAIQAIQNGDCAAALVGACQSNRRLLDWKNYMRNGVLSADGICKPFDSSADGFSRGEGSVAIVIKPLSDALRDHDHIYASIVGTAIATTISGPLNVPHTSTYQECMISAFKKAGKSVNDVDYVELHATGTSVGDPIESDAAIKIFAEQHSVVVGSVKGNIGHLEAAAFLASLAKACLILEKKVIPPNVNLSNLNPQIDWSRMIIPRQPMSLGCRSSSGRSVLSLSSSGIGGATGHVVIEAPPNSSQFEVPQSFKPLFCMIGGLSSVHAERISTRLIDKLASSKKDITEIRECIVSLSRAARQSEWRTYILFSTSLDIHGTIPSPLQAPSTPRSLAFIFSGQGPQHILMGRQLAEEYPVFRNTIVELDDVYKRVVGISFVRQTGLFVANSSSPNSMLKVGAWPVAIILPAIAMVQLALVDLLESFGVKASCMIGHSAGETAILYASGAATKSMAMEVAIARGMAMTVTESMDGGMVALGCESSRALELIKRTKSDDRDGTLSISCFNAPATLTVSGSNFLLEQLINLAASEGIFAQRIRTSVPGHCEMMQACREDYKMRMDKIFSSYSGPFIPKIPVYSTCTDSILVKEFTSDYFWDNAQNPVFFHRALSNLRDSDQILSSSVAFVELSNHPVLSATVQSQFPAQAVVCPMRRPSSKNVQNESLVFFESLGQLFQAGIDCIDLSRTYGKSRFVNWEYPFSYPDIPPMKTHPMPRVLSSVRPMSVIGKSIVKFTQETHPVLLQHIINGEPIMPATGFIEMVLETGAHVMWDVEFRSIFSLASSSPELKLERLGDIGFSITSPREHVIGCMDATANSTEPFMGDISLQRMWDKLPSLNINDFYASLHPVASFGPSFQRLLRCSGTPTEAIAELKGLNGEELSDGYILHPALLDASLHFILHPEISGEFDSEVIYLPEVLERFTLHTNPVSTENWVSVVKLQEWTPERRCYNVKVFQSSGTPICSLARLWVQRYSPPLDDQALSYDYILQPVAITTPMFALDRVEFQRPDRSDIVRLFLTLDEWARRIIVSSMLTMIDTGSELDLDRARYLSFAQDVVRSSRGNTAPPIADDLWKLQERWKSYFEVTSRIEAIHSQVFQSSKSAVSALYEDDLMSRFYSQSVHRTIGRLAQTAFSKTLSAMSAVGKRSLRILEIGAGTGFLTQYLLDEVAQRRDVTVEYTMTDISATLVQAFVEKSSYSYLIPAAYDLSKPPQEQGLMTESFDIIVGFHALHVAPDIRKALNSIHSLLVPGGCLLVADLDGSDWTSKPGTLWHDFIFGCFKEWLHYSDGRTHCTMSPREWSCGLEQTGYLNVRTVSEEGGGFEFLFTAQKIISPIPSSLTTILRPASQVTVISYHYGNELDVQRAFNALEPSAPNTIYFIAMEGRDADAAHGLIVTLTREFEQWSIRLIAFHSSENYDNHLEWISNLSSLFEQGENIVHVTSQGRAYVPRVVPNPHSRLCDVDHDIHEQKGITIEVLEWSPESSIARGILGRVVNAEMPSDYKSGDLVAGMVHSSHKTDIVSLKPGWIIALDPDHFFDGAGESIPGIVLGSMLHPLRSPNGSYTPLKVLVAMSDATIAASVNRFLQASPSIFDCYSPESGTGRCDFILTDHVVLNSRPHLRQFLKRSGRLVMCEDAIRQALSEDSHLVSKALQAHFHHVCSAQNLHLSSIPLHSSTGASNMEPRTMFDSSKAYILLGGIGGIGIAVASWMYQHGARHIILTSRRGRASVNGIESGLSAHMLEYLETRQGLKLQLEACDATSFEDMSKMIKSVGSPVGGCMLMTLVLSDALFMKQTEQSFVAVSDSKLKALEIFSSLVPIESLEFFIAFSSFSGLLGNAGQSNYASTNTTLNGLLNTWQNSFSLVVPAIKNAGFLTTSTSDEMDRLRASGISVEVLCSCIYDGIRMLREGKAFQQYIPPIEWGVIAGSISLPPSCKHLAPKNYSSGSDVENIVGSSQNSIETAVAAARQLVSTALEIKPQELPSTTSLVLLGLDSLSAARLSRSLRPYVQVSQIQLLGQTTWAQLEGLIRGESDDRVTTTTTQDSEMPSIVEICGGEGIPLIVLHDISGSIRPIYMLGERFKALSPSPPLWAIQVTPSTPLSSLSALASYYFAEIKKKRQVGPYHIATFSISSIIGVALIKEFQRHRDQVVELTFIDHFPGIFLCPSYNIQNSDLIEGERVSRRVSDLMKDSIIEMLNLDESPFARNMVTQSYPFLTILDLPSDAEDKDQYWLGQLSEDLLTLILRFLKECGNGDVSQMQEILLLWFAEIRVPMRIFVASHGILATLHEADWREWADLGVQYCRAQLQSRGVEINMEVHSLEAGHFDILGMEAVGMALVRR